MGIINAEQICEKRCLAHKYFPGIRFWFSLKKQRKKRERRSVRKIKIFSAHINVNNLYEEYGGGLLCKYLTGNKLYFI